MFCLVIFRCTLLLESTFLVVFFQFPKEILGIAWCSGDIEMVRKNGGTPKSSIFFSRIFEGTRIYGNPSRHDRMVTEVLTHPQIRF